MRLTLVLLGWTWDWSLEPAAADEPATMDATTDRGYFTSTPISFLPQQATPPEWQPPERTVPWDEPFERG